MFTTADQLSNATKASIDSQLLAMNDFANKALNSFSELAELNIATAKSTLEYASAAAQQMLTVKDAQELFQLTSSQAQPNAEKALAYARHLTSLATKTQAELAKTPEALVAEASRQVNKLIDDLSKAAPAGSENAVAVLKSSVANFNAAYEQVMKASKHVIETAESSLNEVAKQFTPVTEKPARSKKAA